MQGRVIVQAAALAVGLGFIGGASASGFQLLEQNASGLGNAYAGSAVVGENASVVFYNPAAMTKLNGGNISAGLTLIKPSYKFKNDGSSNGSAATGGDGGDAGGIAGLPNLYASWQLSDKWFAGIGVGSPFGLKTEYNHDWAGRFQSQTFDIKTYNVNPSLAVKATDSISLGFGANYQRMEALYQRNAATLNGVTQAAIVTLEATSEAYGWNAGATIKLSPSTELGFSYRSKMFHNLEGTLSSNNQAVSQNAFAKADITLPDTYTFSVAQQISERWEMLGDVSRTNWSTVDKVDIVRTSDAGAGKPAGSVAQQLDANFRDTWRIALGGNYKIDDNWKWKYGIAYDQSPVRGVEERLVSLPDNNRYWLSTGIQWKFDKSTLVDVGVAYLYIPEDKVDANQSSAYRGRVAGSYDGSIIILGAQMTRTF
ncbi:outer membrane protein transport protein [Uliginosibacterium sp. 31-16]|uniref:OmpP1/FadL family transporter n=1 Tax=Uliginosibacterium sp. 31-16 TaxID=3068315 RepID=UPI00273F2A32|nr:outer membrane protein transport protein [Uliginosibacterium sp. 31-16]MDP5241067.1 outer membrane protein transport protein [Uliginosibacterium sp. 31-16]